MDDVKTPDQQVKKSEINADITWGDWFWIALFSLLLGGALAWISTTLPSQSEPGADARLDPAGGVIYGYGHMEGQHFVSDNSGKAR